MADEAGLQAGTQLKLSKPGWGHQPLLLPPPPPAREVLAPLPRAGPPRLVGAAHLTQFTQPITAVHGKQESRHRDLCEPTVVIHLPPPPVFHAYSLNTLPLGSGYHRHFKIAFPKSCRNLFSSNGNRSFNFLR